MALDPFREKYDLWPVVDKRTGEIIGHAGLLEKDVEGRSEVELVYVLARSSWGNGYATEIATAIRNHALLTLGLERLVAIIDPENAASERVAVKTGMHLEAEVLRPDGKVKRVYVVEKRK